MSFEGNNLQEMGKWQSTYVLQKYSKIFLCESALPIKAKFYMKHLQEEGTSVFINYLGHMTKMAAMPIYGKNPSKIFSRGRGGVVVERRTPNR